MVREVVIVTYKNKNRTYSKKTYNELIEVVFAKHTYLVGKLKSKIKNNYTDNLRLIDLLAIIYKQQFNKDMTGDGMLYKLRPLNALTALFLFESDKINKDVDLTDFLFSCVENKKSVDCNLKATYKRIFELNGDFIQYILQVIREYTKTIEYLNIHTQDFCTLSRSFEAMREKGGFIKAIKENEKGFFQKDYFYYDYESCAKYL